MDLKTELNKTLLLGGLPEEELEKILNSGRVMVFEKGDIIFHEGGKASHLFILLGGKVKVFKVSFEGKEQILHLIEPGEPFGEVPVFIGGTYPAHAMAMARSSVFSINKDVFLKLIETYPEMAMHIMGILCMRLRQFASLVEELSLKEVPGRVANYIFYLYEKAGRSKRVTLDMTKNQLASLLGTVPETLSRALSKLKSLGIIEMDGTDILVLDPELLEQAATEGVR